MKCYTRDYGEVYEADYNYVCNPGFGHSTCCASGDKCGADGFCHFTHDLAETVTGYYLGGCTDYYWVDAACPLHCTSYGTQDVIYNATSGLWKCCWGSGELNCEIPSNEAFAASPPEQLFPTSSSTLPATSSTTTTRTTISTTTSSRTTPSSIGPTETHDPDPTTASSMDMVEKNGNTSSILVPAIVVPIIVVVLGIVIGRLWMRKKQQRQARFHGIQHVSHDLSLHEAGVSEKQRIEIGTQPMPQELDTGVKIAELPGAR